MTEEQLELLRDKFVLWDRASREGPMDTRDYNKRAAEALKALLSEQVEYGSAGVEWRAIETAPKDGTPILVWDGESAVTCFWCKCSQHWALVSENCSEWQDVTHWAPLPQPPLVQPGSQGGGHG